MSCTSDPSVLAFAPSRRLLGVLLIVSSGGPALAGDATLFDLTLAPTLDRWVYPFNDQPGTRSEASVFAAPNIPGFDDRDGEFLVGFDTGASVPPGLASWRYRVERVVLSATISQSDRFVYDPSVDPIASSFASEDPDAVTDPDAGRPIELFAAGYRAPFALFGDGVSTQTYTETSAFGGAPSVPPAQDARFVIPLAFDATGQGVNVVQQVREKIDLAPMGVAVTESVAPGASVPAGTRFSAEADLGGAGVESYIAGSLKAGRVNLLFSSLHPAFQGSTQFPVFATRENPLFDAPSLDLLVSVLDDADWNRDGFANDQDFFDFANDFFSPEGADYNDDGFANDQDFFDFVNAFFG